MIERSTSLKQATANPRDTTLLVNSYQAAYKNNKPGADHKKEQPVRPDYSTRDNRFSQEDTQPQSC
jgi:hypothetical protein